MSDGVERGSETEGANDAVMSRLGQLIRPDADVLSEQMIELFLQVIPGFSDDPIVHQLMASSTTANVTAFIDLLEHGIGPDDIVVPPVAAEYARRFAQMDLSIEGLLRGYRLGENAFLRWSVPLLSQLDLDTERALDSVSELSRRSNLYIDQVIEGLIDIYEDERRQWNARSETVWAATIRAVLDSREIDVHTAEATLGSSLRGWHRAALLWTRSSAAIDQVQRELVTITGLVPLSVVPEAGCLWVWWSATSPPPVTPASFDRMLERFPELSVALGSGASGLAGFRTSHQEARRVRALVSGKDGGEAPRRGMAVDYDDVALAAMLAGQSAALRTWVGRTLGDLAHDDDATERLRETLRVYLAADRSSTSAAASLHLHKNTVHYRLRRAEELLGRPLASARLDIEVALLVCHHLGRGLLTR